jgi:D-alanine transaminase
VDRDGRLRMRHLDQMVLPGCTRAALIAEWRRRASPSRWATSAWKTFARRGRRFDLATSFVKAITEVDGAPVGDGTVGPVVRQLFALFARHVEGARNAA